MVLALLRCSTRIGPCSVTSGVVLQHWASGNSEPWESCRTLEEMRKEMDEGKKKPTDTQLAFHVRFLMIRRSCPIENTTSLLSPVSEVLESSSQKPQASLTRTACASAF